MLLLLSSFMASWDTDEQEIVIPVVLKKQFLSVFKLSGNKSVLVTMCVESFNPSHCTPYLNDCSISVCISLGDVILHKADLHMQIK